MQPNVSLKQITEHLGFDPYQASDEVFACAEIASGPHAGYWCVFTTSRNPSAELYDQPNFAGTKLDRPAQSPEGKEGFVYLYSSLKKRKRRASA